jgi:hypothetical protein
LQCAGGVEHVGRHQLAGVLALLNTPPRLPELLEHVGYFDELY